MSSGLAHGCRAIKENYLQKCILIRDRNQNSLTLQFIPGRTPEKQACFGNIPEDRIFGNCAPARSREHLASRASGMQTCFSGADVTLCVEAACSLCHFGHGTLLVTTSRPGIRARHFRIPPQIPFIPQNVAGRGKNMGFRLPECRCRSIMTKNENEDDRCGASGFLRGELRFQEAGRRPVRTSTLPPRSCLPREAAGRFHRAPNGAHHRQS